MLVLYMKLSLTNVADEVQVMQGRLLIQNFQNRQKPLKFETYHCCASRA